MNIKQLEDILSRLKDISILVVGDYFLDKYIMIDRALDEPSLETGLTAYQAIGIKAAPGAAGTVTSNFRALGIGRVIALGVIGEDGEGYDLLKGLEANGVLTDYIIRTGERFTPTYIKPMVIEKNVAGGETSRREINRIDIKNRTATPVRIENAVIEKLQALSGEVDAVVVMDQVTERNCGVITDNVRKALANMGKAAGSCGCGCGSAAKGIKAGNTEGNAAGNVSGCAAGNAAGKPVIYADSRSNTYLFDNIIIKCNQHELLRAYGYNPGIIAAGDKGAEQEKVKPVYDEAGLIAKYGTMLSDKNGKPVFVTAGSRGMIVFDGYKTEAIPPAPAEGPFDICGAGDSATAGIISALCCGAGIRDAALLGNIVASITIQQLGTTGTASPAQVAARFREMENV